LRFSFHDMPEGGRMILGTVAADSQYAIAVGYIIPVIGHCASSERLSQSRYS